MRGATCGCNEKPVICSDRARELRDVAARVRELALTATSNRDCNELLHAIGVLNRMAEECER